VDVWMHRENKKKERNDEGVGVWHHKKRSGEVTTGRTKGPPAGSIYWVLKGDWNFQSDPRGNLKRD